MARTAHAEQRRRVQISHMRVAGWNRCRAHLAGLFRAAGPILPTFTGMGARPASQAGMAWPAGLTGYRPPPRKR
jgi:hypothetical protein